MNTGASAGGLGPPLPTDPGGPGDPGAPRGSRGGLSRRAALRGAAMLGASACLAGCAARSSRPGGRAGAATAGSGTDPAELGTGRIEALLRASPALAPIADDAAFHRLQILVSEVESGRLARHGYRVGAEYFYPASSIKLLGAVAALEWLAEARRTLPVDLASPLAYLPVFADEVREDADASNLDGGTITLGHEVRKLFLVSDNRAYNRCYELVGHRALNESAWRAGLPTVRHVHRLSEARSFQDNLRTPAVEVTLRDGRVFTVPERTSDLSVTCEDVPGSVLDLAFDHDGHDGHVTPAPADFGKKSGLSLLDLQNALILLARPELLPHLRGFALDDDLRAFALAAMREQPKDSKNPVYDAREYPLDELKYLARGWSRAVARGRFDCTNKVGRAYGFSIDNAWFVDRETGRQTFVTVALMTNPNRTLNDGVYAYEDVADPFLAALGEAVARTS